MLLRWTSAESSSGRTYGTTPRKTPMQGTTTPGVLRRRSTPQKVGRLIHFRFETGWLCLGGCVPCLGAGAFTPELTMTGRTTLTTIASITMARRLMFKRFGLPGAMQVRSPFAFLAPPNNSIICARYRRRRWLDPEQRHPHPRQPASPVDDLRSPRART